MRIWIGILTLCLAFSASAQKIYKVVDENGNVTYTDQPPSEDAQPADLPEISIIKSDTNNVGDGFNYGLPPENNDSKSPAKPYKDLRFAYPSPDQNLWGTGGTVSATLESKTSLLPEHKVQFYVDGELAGTSSSYSYNIPDVFRGEHFIRAVVVDASGRRVASAGPVRFYIKQQSQLNPNNPSVRRRAGNG